MIAKELISQTIDSLRTSDTGEETIAMMGIYHVKHLPIVNNEQFLGMISEEDILDKNMNEAIGSYRLSMLKPYAHQNDHLFEVMKLMAENKLTVIPVVDNGNKYLGLITQEDLIAFFAISFSFAESGSILVIETDKINYSLAEIARIVEGEGGSILAAFLTRMEDSTKIQITLKLNQMSVGRIVASLERFDYNINGAFTENKYEDILKNRYDSLMSYLNV